MFTVLIVATVSFLLGAAVVFARFGQRFEQMRKTDPFENPPTPDVRQFVETVQAHLSTWRRLGWTRAPANIQNVRQALRALVAYSESRSVWLVEDGVVTMQDGTQVPIHLIVRHLEEELKAARSSVARANLCDLSRVVQARMAK